MEDKGYTSFSEFNKSTEEKDSSRCKSLYDNRKVPAYYPFHSYQKNKAKSVSWFYILLKNIKYCYNDNYLVRFCIHSKLNL